jgi:chorismate dehydratase
MELELDIPSVCAKKLLQNKVDIGLVPVAILTKMKDYEILSDYCIGTNGNVKSVNLYSDVPLDNITEVILDFHSQSSITLVKVLSKFYWKKEFKFTSADESYIQKISGSTAGVVIGDRTFGMENSFSFIYDLSKEWLNFTGLPFVFACWVANKKINNPPFLNLFNSALKFGIENKKEVITHLSLQTEYKKINLDDYLSNCINYNFDDSKKHAMQKFLEYSRLL